MKTWPERLAEQVENPPVDPISNPSPVHDPDSEDLVLVQGHHVVGKGYRSFPHRCPGKACAINVWMQAHPWR